MPDRGDLADLLVALLDGGVDFVLVGMLSAVVHGVPVLTYDADVVHDRTGNNVRRLVGILARLGAFYQRRSPESRIEPTVEGLMLPGHNLLRTSIGDLDVLGAIEGGLGYAELLAHSDVLAFEGRPLRVLRLERLAEIKARSTQAKDRFALLHIREVLSRRSDA